MSDAILLSIGEVNNNKNHKVIIEALEKIESENLRYFIVGKGSEEESLYNLANELGLSDKVNFLGFREDISNLLKTADIFCFPSKREELGLACIEAMAYSLPLVTSNIQGIRDYNISGMTGYAVDATNPTLFAKAIEQLLFKDLSVISKRNANLAKKYDVSKVQEYMRKIYSKQDWD